MTGINLIPGPRLLAARRKARTHAWLIAGGAYALVLMSMLGAAAAAWETDVATPEIHLHALQQEHARHRSQVQQLSTDIQTKQRELAANQAVGSQPDWSILLALIARSLGDDAALTHARLVEDPPPPPPPPSPPPAPPPTSPPPAPPTVTPASQPAKAAPAAADLISVRSFSLRLTGIASSQAAVARVVDDLEKSGLFDHLDWRETRRESADSPLVRFTLECRIGGGSGSGK